MNTSASPTVLRLEGEMTIYRAQELHQLLVTPLLAGQSLEVDLSGVTEFDTVGVQLMLLAQRAASEKNGVVRWSQPSEAVREVLDVLHLSAVLAS